MKLLFIAALIAAAAQLGAQSPGKRVAGLEKRVTTVEKRVSTVEKRVAKLEGGAAASDGKAAQPSSPITAFFIKKKQVVSQEKIGIKLYVEFENVSNRRLYAFSGTLVFRDEAGAVVWSRAYGYSEPILPGGRAQAELAVSSDRAREYLKLVKAKGLTVSLEKQEAYGAQ
jgi:hypothetical protein